MVMKAMLEMLLPLACEWAEDQEGIILRQGIELNAAQLDDAHRIGVRHPNRVRLHAVEKVPSPLHPLLQKAAEDTGLLSPGTAGMTLRYGIFIRADCWGGRRLVVHELAHTAQYERLGGFRPFLKEYLNECITPPGYPFGPLEQEAKRMEQVICITGV
jgi:hypothetical protein